MCCRFLLLDRDRQFCHLLTEVRPESVHVCNNTGLHRRHSRDELSALVTYMQRQYSASFTGMRGTESAGRLPNLKSAFWLH